MAGYPKIPCQKTLEIGAGWGIMAFEFARTSNAEIDCVELDLQSIQTGIRLSRKTGSKVRFIQDFLPNLNELKGNMYCQVLLIDVLEHVLEDAQSLSRINTLLENSGYLIISVPTQNYPKFFGYKFANQIGHVRDGYTIENLMQLLDKAGFNIVSWKYHTNALSSFLCKLWYATGIPESWKIALFPIFKMLISLDPIDAKINSCGIAVKARKVKAL